jgi:hypothetical protein
MGAPQEYTVEPDYPDAGDYTFAVADLDGNIVALCHDGAMADLIAELLTDEAALDSELEGS